MLMNIEREILDELTGLQEDVASSFTDENLLSGEVYWTVVESLATAKLAELRGELVPDFV
jgi:hypothetical protein